MTLVYRALALQTLCHAVNGCASIEEAQARIAANITTVGRQICA